MKAGKDKLDSQPDIVSSGTCSLAQAHHRNKVSMVNGTAMAANIQALDEIMIFGEPWLDCSVLTKEVEKKF